MKVIARHWVNYNGTWYKGGEEFDADDFETVKAFAEKKEPDGFVSDVFPPEVNPAETKRKAGRPRKSQE